MSGVRVETQQNVVVITIDRPKANAIDAQTSHEIYRAIADFEADERFRACVLTGAGERFFSAGWDLKSAEAGESHDADHGPGGFAGLTEFHDRSKPIIAAVNGSAFGGGVELLLATDLAVASRTANFAFPEAGLGISANAGGIGKLQNYVPRRVALELLLTGRRFTAAEALNWGLVNDVVEPEEVLAVSIAMAQAIAHSAPLSVQAILTGSRLTQGLTDEAAFRQLRSLPIFGRIAESEDAREGIAAYSERRVPNWRGK